MSNKPHVTSSELHFRRTKSVYDILLLLWNVSAIEDEAWPLMNDIHAYVERIIYGRFKL